MSEKDKQDPYQHCRRLVLFSSIVAAGSTLLRHPIARCWPSHTMSALAFPQVFLVRGCSSTLLVGSITVQTAVGASSPYFCLACWAASPKNRSPRRSPKPRTTLSSTHRHRSGLCALRSPHYSTRMRRL